LRRPLQNRATPSGDIVATPQRGLFIGNRGIIHDPATKTLLNRRWSSKAWLTCVCEFRGRRRDVMGTRSWTELFFLDEATAFAAGLDVATENRADFELLRDTLVEIFPARHRRLLSAGRCSAQRSRVVELIDAPAPG